ncbi:MAG: hypothetical protein HeimC3_50280 [Candidatus Heimdallarchaeota archaeon LC_3]|nr:MAG: hypothetical protein HeimC3_50280 [Candidatus Heimdallarchaeota archaeon LC_3]
MISKLYLVIKKFALFFINSFSNLAIYFEFIRSSLRNVILELDGYFNSEAIINSDIYWRNLISQLMNSDKIESEYLDFKETLSLWHTKGEEKRKKKIKICGIVAGFANNQGGIVVIGITDIIPRNIVGINDVEKKLIELDNLFSANIQGINSHFTKFNHIRIEDKNKTKRDCLIITIAQTREILYLKDINNSYFYPIRRGAGIVREDPEKIKKLKHNLAIKSNNYSFLKNL